MAVLSEDYWVTRFKQDADVLGKTLVVNGQPLTVVGVAPRGFDGTTRGTRAKLFVPITLRATMEPPFTGFEDRQNYWAYLFARLKPGVSMESARAGINAPYANLIQQELPLQKGLADAKKAEFAAKRVTLADGRRGQSYILTQAGTPLTILQVVTLIVLLIACANVANLLLARGASRAAEMAVRLSIGASRGQLVRQLLLESCLLAALGGVAGLVVFSWTVSIMTSYLPFGAIDPAAARLTWEVLLFATGISVATGVLFGIFPAFHATRPDLATTLKGQAGQPSGARAAAYFRTSLVVVQIALSMGLLACAGLFGKSLLNVSRVDLGVTIDHVITFSLAPQRNGYTRAACAGAVPAGAGAALGDPRRHRGLGGARAADREQQLQHGHRRRGPSAAARDAAGHELQRDLARLLPDGRRAAPGRPRLHGRATSSSAPKVAIVNEAFARKFKLGANPVGRRFRRGGSDKDPYDIEIVGLVRDAKYSSVRNAVPAVFFLPYRQNDRIGSIAFYAKTSRDPSSLVVRHPAAHRVDRSESSGAAVDDDAGAGGEQRLAGSDS